MLETADTKVCTLGWTVYLNVLSLVWYPPWSMWAELENLISVYKINAKNDVKASSIFHHWQLKIKRNNHHQYLLRLTLLNFTYLLKTHQFFIFCKQTNKYLVKLSVKTPIQTKPKKENVKRENKNLTVRYNSVTINKKHIFVWYKYIPVDF